MCIWFENDDDITVAFINGTIIYIPCHIANIVGEWYSPQTKENAYCLSRPNFLLLMYPPKHLINIVALMNYQLHENNKESVAKDKKINFFDVLILGTQYEFEKIVDLWDTKGVLIYPDTPRIEKKEWQRDLFDEIWSCIHLSNQPSHRRTSVLSYTHW